MKIVGVGGLDVAERNRKGIKTFALGSCVALILVHPPSRRVGMAHVALPNSRFMSEKSKPLPAYHADLAFPALLERMSAGLPGEPRREMFAVLIGGARMNDQNDLFQIGPRNTTALRTLLAAAGIPIRAEDLGGAQVSRTVAVENKAWRVVIHYGGSQRETVIPLGRL